MKEKKLEKAEMKESILTGEALALNDAELEGATGGCSNSERGDGLEEHAFDMLRQVHEMYKSGGNLPAEEPDLSMIEQEMAQKADEIYKKLDPYIIEQAEQRGLLAGRPGTPGQG